MARPFDLKYSLFRRTAGTAGPEIEARLVGQPRTPHMTSFSSVSVF